MHQEKSPCSMWAIIQLLQVPFAHVMLYFIYIFWDVNTMGLVVNFYHLHRNKMNQKLKTLFIHKKIAHDDLYSRASQNLHIESVCKSYHGLLNIP